MSAAATGQLLSTAFDDTPTQPSTASAARTRGAAGARGGIGLEYVVDGAGEPYSAGRGESDDIYKYYSRHSLPRSTAPSGRGWAAQENRKLMPVSMTCSRCQGGACMYQSPSAEPFCAECNRSALEK